jgi:CDP-diacylglycerol--glycerol-3-phosphate 3-phosphatidyltransferase
MFFNLPTLLTWLRILAIPLVLLPFSALLGSWSAPEKGLLAAVIFVIASVTDALDGILARRMGQTTQFGAFLDPVADKLLVCAALLVLLSLGRVDVWVALIVVGREISISALREWMARLGASRKIAVHSIGKIKTCAQMIAIPFLLYAGSDWINTTGVWLMRLAAILTLVSMIYYCAEAYKVIRYRGGFQKRFDDRRERSGYRHRRRPNSHHQRAADASHEKAQLPDTHREQTSQQRDASAHHRHNESEHNGRERRGVYGRRRRYPQDDERSKTQDAS